MGELLHVPAYDFALSVALGVGLAAAVGLRVFLPMLLVSAAACTGHLGLAPGFEWLGTLPALLTLGTAALCEVAAYYVPGLDHVLDVLGAPAAVVAGSALAAAVMVDVPPLVRWTLAVIAGGGAAGVTQALTALLRLKSAALTGGLANPLVASGELSGAVLLTLLTLAAPLLGLSLAGLALFWLLRRLRARRRLPAP